MTRKRIKTKRGPSGSPTGQLAIDVFETDNDVTIKAPIAGVEPDDLEISITDDVVTIEGERKKSKEAKSSDYFIQECYWGKFSRKYILPIEVDGEKGKAEIKDGVLTITIPKTIKSQRRVISIQKR